MNNNLFHNNPTDSITEPDQFNQYCTDTEMNTIKPEDAHIDMQPLASIINL